jgi:hypothetical protein
VTEVAVVEVDTEVVVAVFHFVVEVIDFAVATAVVKVVSDSVNERTETSVV